MILIAAENCFNYQLNVNSLMRTRDISLNKMIPLNGSRGDILSHKSQLIKCIEVKHFYFLFFGRHLELHKEYNNLAIENSFNRFFGHLNVGLDTKNILSKLIKKLDMLKR